MMISSQLLRFLPFHLLPLSIQIPWKELFRDIVWPIQLGCGSGCGSGRSRSRGRDYPTTKRELTRPVRNKRPNPIPPSTQRARRPLCKLLPTGRRRAGLLCGRLSLLDRSRVPRACRTFDRGRVRVFTQIDWCPTPGIWRGCRYAWRTSHPTSFDTLYSLEEICRTGRKSFRDGFASWGELLANFEVLDTFLEAQPDVSHHRCHPCAWMSESITVRSKELFTGLRGSNVKNRRVLLTLVRQYRREAGLLHVPTLHTHSSVEILISIMGYNLGLSCSPRLHQKVEFEIRSR